MVSQLANEYALNQQMNTILQPIEKTNIHIDRFDTCPIYC